VRRGGSAVRATRRWLCARGEGGYVAIMTGLLMVVFVGLAAIAVDLGRAYVVGQQGQRAADAAALAGVVSLPGDVATARSTALSYSARNGFKDGADATVVTADTDGRPTRLRVTVRRTVSTLFASVLGHPTQEISRTAVADYAGPVPMGSPCNEFGDDPDPAGHRSANCNGTGAFWANVGSPKAPKGNGDAYQNDKGNNTDYDDNGYFYSVTVRHAVANLRIEAFDPALIDVGDACTTNRLSVAKTLPASSTVVTDPGTRYANGSGSSYCTGDVRYGGTGQVATEFTVRAPSDLPWDPLSFPPLGGTCTQTFAGFSGDLSTALDTTNLGYKPDVAGSFRQWKTLCTIADAQPGTYMVQVKTNLAGNELTSGHNRFSLRAYGASAADNDAISIAGYNKMAMYGNTPNGTSRFFLARVPTSAQGQVFNVRLYDIGDGAVAGSTVTILPPSETGGTFSGCKGAGQVVTTVLTGCRISVSSSYNAKWQTIGVPIPTTYSCTDSAPTGCWVRLEFFYGNGSSPADTTSWTASIQGDPVRLVE
jgi:Flp pilus assembly protein TadG